MKTKAFALFLSLTAISGISYCAFGATPLHHYTFDQAGVVQDMVGAANGNLIDGAAVGSGILGLDGISQYVEFGQPLIPTTGNFSLTFFAKEGAPSSDRAELVSQGSWFGPGFYFGYYPPSRTIRVGDEWQNAGVSFPDDELWHHYAVTVDDTAACLYIDGALVASSTPIHIAAGGNNTRLGRQYEPWTEYYHGSLDELWIFDGALTAAEVIELAEAKPIPVVVPVTIREVRFSFPTERGAIYQAQFRSSATTNQWVNLGRPILGTGRTAFATDRDPAPDAAYRALATVLPRWPHRHDSGAEIEGEAERAFEGAQ